jgi:hypothetical protein
VTGVQQHLADFVQEHAAGGVADPVAFLARAAPADREELGDLIDGYLSRAPRQSFDTTRFAGSAAERVVADLESVLLVTGGWRVLLPRLRQQAQLKRSDLVARLASELNVGDKQAKVTAYYHEMEQGRLAPDGVSDRVLDALATLLGQTRQALRAAGRTDTPPAGSGTVPAFARRVTAAEPASSQPSASAPQPEAWDEVDQLFKGR